LEAQDFTNFEGWLRQHFSFSMVLLMNAVFVESFRAFVLNLHVIEFKMSRLLITFFFVVAMLDLLGQTVGDDTPDIIFDRQQLGGANINLNGFGIFYNYLKYKDAKHLRLFNIDINFVKHEKERRTPSLYQDPQVKSYIYGKQNNFYTIRLGLGQKIVQTEKLRKGGVQLGYTWQGGATLGFTKPVYLQIVYINQTPLSEEYFIEIEKFDADRHFAENIYGRASGLRGLGEMKFHPGIYWKSAVYFEFSNYKDGLKGIETGISADAFLSRIPIMSPKVLEQKMTNPKNHQVFVALYINFFLGSKENI
jgi:hypothetical protein